ncbi:electron transfer flavoprotein subunit alpha/FixB family protein [Actinospica sp. MGRD01-02]|uniref:Electron transfer flavoprotein subunit alpha/FixB family protein n=1 Tax=Actinospica acidithermotolerans TaxID=2828514 RepID=A0A941E8G4_9ACTN|nr:electron transfer flavoprotein subunit alpha/FixB family protein [Actinospica acidithermotolerans]MBR7826986.1 electron transfer flavoprotein subunit alpha/FixB family protein [Actinospica acidithermotolerans]
MSEVLVLIDHVAGSVRKPTFELLTIAKRLGSPSAVFIGSPEHVEGVVEQVREYGADKLYPIDDAGLRDYLVAPKAEALQQLAAGRDVAAILLPSSAENKEIAGRLAVKLQSGLITDAVDVAADGTTTQSVFAGGYSVTARVTKGTPIITVKPNSAAPEASPGSGIIEHVDVTISEGAKTAVVEKREPRQSTGRPELTEAAIVVSGGRGTNGDFAEVERLADALGAAVGASRAAVDSGWIPYAFQVGQTGKTVSPRLYVANGISGAIQHRAGMQTSKTIVAVNKDAEAPIFAIADFGVVGDLDTVLPALTAEVARRKG